MCLWSLVHALNHCFILSDKTGLLHFLKQHVTLTALFLRFLSCFPGGCASLRKKARLIVRQEVTKSGLFMFCILMYFKYAHGEVVESEEIAKQGCTTLDAH